MDEGQDPVFRFSSSLTNVAPVRGETRMCRTPASKPAVRVTTADVLGVRFPRSGRSPQATSQLSTRHAPRSPRMKGGKRQDRASAYPRIPPTLRGWYVVSRWRGTKISPSSSTVHRADCPFPGDTVVSSFVRTFSLAKPEAVRKRYRQARPQRWTTSSRSSKSMWRRLALP